MGFSDDTPGPPGILHAPPGCPGPPGYETGANASIQYHVPHHHWIHGVEEHVMIKRLPPPAHHLMALDVGHMKSLLTVQAFLENREYHRKIAPGDHLKTWKTWINLLEII